MNYFDFLVKKCVVKLKIIDLKLKIRFWPVIIRKTWKETVTELNKAGIQIEWEDDAQRYVAIGPAGERRFGETEIDAVYYLLKSCPELRKKPDIA